MKRLLDYDPFTGVETWHELVGSETQISYVPTWDAQTSIDYCQNRANDTDYTSRGIKEDWWQYGHVPNWLMLEWNVRHGIPIGDAEAYNRMLNRPEYKYFKTTHKHHGVDDKKIFLG